MILGDLTRHAFNRSYYYSQHTVHVANSLEIELQAADTVCH